MTDPTDHAFADHASGDRGTADNGSTGWGTPDNGSTDHDARSAGDDYEAVMGRWSRLVAPRFLDWLGADLDLDWMDVGCGTGALSSTILDRCRPRSIVGIDTSDAFVMAARTNVPDERVRFQAGDAQALPLEDACIDVAASALAVNFVPNVPKALSEMTRVSRSGGTVAFYVWDHPGGGIEFIRCFWRAAISLDPSASRFGERKRFPFCTPDGLTALAAGAGLQAITCQAIEVPTVFPNFQDFWRPFTRGVGPAPGYCVSLDDDARERLRQRLQRDLPSSADGAIELKARAWAVKALVT